MVFTLKSLLNIYLRCKPLKKTFSIHFRYIFFYIHRLASPYSFNFLILMLILLESHCIGFTFWHRHILIVFFFNYNFHPVCPFTLFLCEAPRNTGFDKRDKWYTNKRYYYCYYYKSKIIWSLFVLVKYWSILTVPANNELSAQIRRYTGKLIYRRYLNLFIHWPEASL